MADIDKKRLVIYRSNIEDEDIDAAREALKECYPDGTFSDQEVAQYATENNVYWRECERKRLDIPLLNEVIAIKRMGFWNSSIIRYQRLGFNVNGILQFCKEGDDLFYANAKTEEVYCDNPRHDGTNLFLFRMMKDGANVYEFLSLAKHHNLTMEEIRKFTCSLYPYVAKVYGWPINSSKC